MFSPDEHGVSDTYEVTQSVSDGEVYLKKILITNVNSWSQLQSAIDDGNYEKVIKLTDNIRADSSQTRIRIYDGDIVTIDLNGKTLNRNRQSSDGDGHVIEVRSGGKLTVTDSAGGGCITGGYATRGGGVNVNNGGSFTLAGGNITGNQAEDGGGIYVNDSATFTMTGGTVTENTASDEGGGIDLENSATLTGGNITDNTAKYGGGVYYDEGGETLKLSNVTIRENTSNHRGGGIYIWHGTVQLNSCTVSENTAKDGGAVYITDECKLDASNTVFEKNKSTNAGGGAIVNMEDLVLSSCTFTSNTAENNGGAIYNAGTAVAESCTFRKNTSLSGRGGAICQYDGSFTLNGGTIQQNVAADKGCGVYVDVESDSFNIRGNLNITDNSTNSVYLANGMTVNISGPLSGSAKIGIAMFKISGTFTRGYKTYHGGEDPSKYFIPDKNYAVITDDNGEAMVIESDWSILRRQFENSGDYGVIKLDRDWTAIKDDTALTVAEGKSIVLDLNGHKIDAKNNIGTVINVNANGMLTITDSSQGGKGVITGGNGVNGGAIVNKGTLKINGGEISGNTATLGGAVYNEGDLEVNGGVIKGNTATNGAGIYNKSGTCTISRVEFQYDSSKLQDNTAKEYGGAVYIEGGAVTLKDCTISGNAAGKEGGGVFLSENQDVVLNAVAGPEVQNNKAPIGNNILLSKGKKLNLTGYVYPSAHLDLVTKDTDKALTSGYTSSNSNRGAFTYNGKTAGLFEKDEELWMKTVEGDVEVSSWDQLQTAIKNSSENQVILVKNDLDGKNKDWLNVPSGKNVTVELNGHTIDRNRQSKDADGHVFWVRGGAHLTITDAAGTGVITGGYATNGGGINIAENAVCTINGGSIQGNNAVSGGGIFVRGILEMNGGAVSFNKCDKVIGFGGGIYVSETGRIELNDALVIGNSAISGTGIYFASENNTGSYIKDSEIADNYAADSNDNILSLARGIVMNAEGKTLTIEKTRIHSHIGGGIMINDGTVLLKNCSVSGNSSMKGGAVLIKNGKLEAKNTSFNGNSATDGEGGAIYTEDELSLTGCEIKNNTATGDGGGLYFDNDDQTYPITDTKVEGNETTEGSGGGIYVEEGELKYTGGSISYNKSHQSGGGVYVNADGLGLSTDNTVIDYNQTDKAEKPVFGGGVFVQTGRVRIHGGSISNNFAKYSGGGIYVTSSTSAHLEPGSDDSPVVFDHNDCDLNGGAIYVDEDAYVYVNKCIVENDDCPHEAVFCEDDLYVRGWNTEENGETVEHEALFITRNNKGNDVYIEDDGDRILVSNKLSEDCSIGVALSWKTGKFTNGFSDNHKGKDPETYFYACEEGYSVGLDDGGEAIIRSTDWIQLQNLIDAAQSGETVTLQKNYDADKYDTSLEIPANKSLTLDLNGFTLDGGDAIRLIKVNAKATLTIADTAGTGILTGGNTTLGGGVVYNEGTLNINGGIFAGNTAGTGGAVWNNGTMTVTAGTFTDNKAKSNGGAITNLNKLTISGGEFAQNTANGFGGGIYNNGEMTLETCSVTNNDASAGGGIYCAAEGKLKAKNAPSVIGNTASSGKNILLSEGTFVKLDAKLTAGAKLDVSTQDVNSPLTSGFGTSETEKSVFSYNENPYVTLILKEDGELYYHRSCR